MVHKLAIVAFTGLVVSAVAMGAAASIGVREFKDGFDGLDFSMFGDRPRCEKTGGATASSRTLEWDDGDEVSLAVPGRARYTPNGDKEMHISGDPEIVAHVRVRDGHIELDCRSRNWGDHALEITLPGTPMKKFGIAGSGKLELNDLDQREIRVSIAGSGSIKARGKVDEVRINIAGSGDADLGEVASEDATIKIAGSGNADVAPRDEVEVHIAGSGDVNLHTNPRHVETHIIGSGRIHNVGSGI
ncbi:MAG TPA: DUF2807 domain-containing protein [Rhizomicrobium sp.]|nr:DUF2807 domain-containing protein [Rhizomicrobium sp.]